MSADLIVARRTSLFHLARRGICLWANRLVFSPSSQTQMAPAAANGSVMDVRAPGIADGQLEADDGETLEATGADPAAPAAAPADVPPAPANALPPMAKQVAPRMVTLALLPRAQVQAMLHLDTLKMRAKPDAPPTKPAAAPFFLPTTPSLARNPTFVATVDAQAPNSGHGGVSRVTHVGRLQDGGAAARSPLLRAIMGGDDAAAMAHIRGVSASVLDVELRSLTLSSPDPKDLLPDDAQALLVLLGFLTRHLSTGCEFELVHATLACVLRIHGDACAAHPQLRAALHTLRDIAQDSWRRLDGRFQQARGVLSFVAGLGHA